MSYSATVYRVLISSPSDTVKEREAIPEIIYTWNSINSENFNVVLLPVLWETHTTPQMGDRPQEIINKQIVDSSDILIGTFWTRIGTKTGKSESGTVEEIEEFISSEKPVLLYFSSRPVEPTSIDHEQYKRLKSFKEKCKEEGLIENYSEISELRKKVSRHLTSLVMQLTEGIETDIQNYLEEQDELENIKKQFSIYLNRVEAEWVAEKVSEPYSIDTGKYILLDFGTGLLDFRTMLLEASIEENIIEDLDNVIKETKIIQKHTVTLDGGVSYRDFWGKGDKIIEKAKQVLNKI